MCCEYVCMCEGACECYLNHDRYENIVAYEMEYAWIKKKWFVYKCKTMRLFLKSVNGKPADDYIAVVVVCDTDEQYVCGFLINCPPKKNRLL